MLIDPVNIAPGPAPEGRSCLLSRVAFRWSVVVALLPLVPLGLGACHAPAEPAPQVRQDGTDGSIASSSRPLTSMSPSLRAAYIRARQAAASPRYFVTSGARTINAQTSGAQPHVHNQDHGFFASFADTGLLLSGGSWSVALRLRRYGYAARLQLLTTRRPRASANRVSYQHRSAGGTPLTEWYLNGPLGLEHGFTLHRPPVFYL